MHTFIPKGTCSKEIQFDVQGGVITACSFARGCSGNLQGISKLVIGRDIDEVIGMLQGIQCQNGTSCPDQLSKALIQYKQSQE